MNEFDNENQLNENFFTTCEKSLTDNEKRKLAKQNERLISDFEALQLEAQAQKHWDLFHRRHKTQFYRSRRWTKREFQELIEDSVKNTTNQECRKLLEVGCGVGNFVYPFMEELEALGQLNNYFYACDFSPRAIEFVRANSKYNENKIKAFQCDITTDTIHDHITPGSVDIISMIFVMSAITPEKYNRIISNLYKVLKPGGIILFRDYGRYDMAQLRITKFGHKISENFYMRQDGTRSYYFAEQELTKLFADNRFGIISNEYLHRRPLNVKKGRIFLQGKFRKL